MHPDALDGLGVGLKSDMVSGLWHRDYNSLLKLRKFARRLAGCPAFASDTRLHGLVGGKRWVGSRLAPAPFIWVACVSLGDLAD